jgi:hypothetical protein
MKPIIFLIFMLSPFFCFTQSEQVDGKPNSEGKITSISENKSLKVIDLKRKECESLITKLHLNGMENEALKTQYEELRIVFNTYLDEILVDVNEINSIGTFTEYFIKSKSRQMKYENLVAIANDKHDLFVNNAIKTLYVDKEIFGGPVGLVLDVMTTLLPGAIVNSVNNRINMIKAEISKNIKEKKFIAWDEITGMSKTK